MLNALWEFMMLTGLGWAAVHGTLGAVTEGMLAAAGDAVSLGITMLGVMAFWTGILEIGRRAGLIEQLSAGMRPVLHFLFPRIPAGHPALSSMAANMIANMLGLGWAATPAGLTAMKELEELEEERRAAGDPAAVTQGTASDEMCTFSGRKYFIAAAHSYQYDRLPEPVRIGASAGSGRSGVPGDLCQHAGRSGGVTA